MVPTVRVQLVTGVKLLLQHGTKVQIQTQGDCEIAETLLVEPDSLIADLELSIEPTVLKVKDGTRQIVITNSTGYTQRLDQGSYLGTLEAAEIILSDVNTSGADMKANVQLKEKII